MKKLKNVTTQVQKDAENKTTYADLAAVCINVMPQGGLDVSQMKARLDVMTAIENANGNIELATTAQVETLKDCVKTMRWAIMHKDVVDFIEAVEKL
jgi:hypothetical protein